MTLYEEIIFLQHHFSGKYCVENVIPYYEPLVPAQKRGRHLYWCNFNLPTILSDRDDSGLAVESLMDALCEFHKYDFRKYNGEQRMLKIARNLVDYEAGLTIFNTARGVINESKSSQGFLFS